MAMYKYEKSLWIICGTLCLRFTATSPWMLLLLWVVSSPLMVAGC